MKENIKEKKYLFELSEQLKQQLNTERVVCGFNEDVYGRAVVTTGIPKEYKEGKITYKDEKTVSYEDHIISEFQRSATKRR